MTASRHIPEWSTEALFAKAQRYAQMMLESDRTQWQFGFWSALALEMQARAALASVSPTLIADAKDWTNLLYALGHSPAEAKFSPKSIEANELLKRLETLFPEFTREMSNYSATHMNKRNSELHSGALPFDGVGSSTWLPMYYLVSKTLCEAMGQTLNSLFGNVEAKNAEAHISALLDESAKSVKRTISAHRVIWEGKDAAERDKLTKQAETTALRFLGHRTACPACGTTALIRGTAIGSPRTGVEDGYIVERNAMLPSAFSCRACGLKIVGYSKLNACGLGDSFTSTMHFDAVDYFDIQVEDEDGYRGFDEDNNEP